MLFLDGRGPESDRITAALADDLAPGLFLEGDHEVVERRAVLSEAGEVEPRHPGELEADRLVHTRRGLDLALHGISERFGADEPEGRGIVREDVDADAARRCAEIDLDRAVEQFREGGIVIAGADANHVGRSALALREGEAAVGEHVVRLGARVAVHERRERSHVEALAVIREADRRTAGNRRSERIVVEVGHDRVGRHRLLDDLEFVRVQLAAERDLKLAVDLQVPAGEVEFLFFRGNDLDEFAVTGPRLHRELVDESDAQIAQAGRAGEGAFDRTDRDVLAVFDGYGLLVRAGDSGRNVRVEDVSAVPLRRGLAGPVVGLELDGEGRILETEGGIGLTEEHALVHDFARVAAVPARRSSSGCREEHVAGLAGVGERVEAEEEGEMPDRVLVEIPLHVDGVLVHPLIARIGGQLDAGRGVHRADGTRRVRRGADSKQNCQRGPDQHPTHARPPQTRVPQHPPVAADPVRAMPRGCASSHSICDLTLVTGGLAGRGPQNPPSGHCIWQPRDTPAPSRMRCIGRKQPHSQEVSRVGGGTSL